MASDHIDTLMGLIYFPGIGIQGYDHEKEYHGLQLLYYLYTMFQGYFLPLVRKKGQEVGLKHCV